MMQPRFEKRVGSTPFGLVDQARFRAGFDFLRLRADIEEVDIQLADWWQAFSMASDAEREDLVQAAKAEQLAMQATKPRVRRAPRPDSAVTPRSTPHLGERRTAAFDADVADDDGAAKKHRRRRHKPGAGEPSVDPRSSE
jgi:poly(A) polymerase